MENKICKEMCVGKGIYYGTESTVYFMQRPRHSWRRDCWRVLAASGLRWSGVIGMKACENMGKYPESSGKIRTAMFMAMAW